MLLVLILLSVSPWTMAIPASHNVTEVRIQLHHTIPSNCFFFSLSRSSHFGFFVWKSWDLVPTRRGGHSQSKHFGQNFQNYKLPLNCPYMWSMRNLINYWLRHLKLKEMFICVWGSFWHNILSRFFPSWDCERPIPTSCLGKSPFFEMGGSSLMVSKEIFPYDSAKK